jgi:hypothetical protein
VTLQLIAFKFFTVTVKTRKVLDDRYIIVKPALINFKKQFGFHMPSQAQLSRGVPIPTQETASVN